MVQQKNLSWGSSFGMVTTLFVPFSKGFWSSPGCCSWLGDLQERRLNRMKARSERPDFFVKKAESEKLVRRLSDFFDFCSLNF